MAVSACHLAAVTQLAGAVPSRRTAGGVGNARAEGLGVGWQSCGSGWGSGKASAGGRGPCEGTAGVTQAKPEVCGWSCLGPGLGRGCSKPQQNHLRACVHLVAFSGALPSCTHPHQSAILGTARTQGPSRPFPLPSPPMFMAPSAPYNLAPTTPSTPALRGPAGIEASSRLPTTTTRALQKPPGHAASRPASPIAQLVRPGGHSTRPPGTSPQPRQPPCDALNPVQRESPRLDTPPRSMGWRCSFTQALGGRATASWGPCHHRAVSPCLWQALPVLCATGTATLVTLGPAGAVAWSWHRGYKFPLLIP